MEDSDFENFDIAEEIENWIVLDETDDVDDVKEGCKISGFNNKVANTDISVSINEGTIQTIEDEQSYLETLQSLEKDSSDDEPGDVNATHRSHLSSRKDPIISETGLQASTDNEVVDVNTTPVEDDTAVGPNEDQQNKLPSVEDMVSENISVENDETFNMDNVEYDSGLITDLLTLEISLADNKYDVDFNRVDVPVANKSDIEITDRQSVDDILHENNYLVESEQRTKDKESETCSNASALVGLKDSDSDSSELTDESTTESDTSGENEHSDDVCETDTVLNINISQEDLQMESMPLESNETNDKYEYDNLNDVSKTQNISRLVSNVEDSSKTQPISCEIKDNSESMDLDETDEDRQKKLQSVIDKWHENSDKHEENSVTVGNTANTLYDTDSNGNSSVIDIQDNRRGHPIIDQIAIETNEDQQSLETTENEEHDADGDKKSVHVDQTEKVFNTDEINNGPKVMFGVEEINSKNDEITDMNVDRRDGSVLDTTTKTNEDRQDDVESTTDIEPENCDLSEKSDDLDNAIDMETASTAGEIGDSLKTARTSLEINSKNSKAVIIQISRIDFLLEGKNTIKIGDQPENSYDIIESENDLKTQSMTLETRSSENIDGIIHDDHSDTLVLERDTTETDKNQQDNPQSLDDSDDTLHRISDLGEENKSSKDNNEIIDEEDNRNDSLIEQAGHVTDEDEMENTVTDKSQGCLKTQSVVVENELITTEDNDEVTDTDTNRNDGSNVDQIALETDEDQQNSLKSVRVLENEECNVDDGNDDTVGVDQTEKKCNVDETTKTGSGVGELDSESDKVDDIVADVDHNRFDSAADSVTKKDEHRRDGLPSTQDAGHELCDLSEEVEDSDDVTASGSVFNAEQLKITHMGLDYGSQISKVVVIRIDRIDSLLGDKNTIKIVDQGNNQQFSVSNGDESEVSLKTYPMTLENSAKTSENNGKTLDENSDISEESKDVDNVAEIETINTSNRQDGSKTESTKTESTIPEIDLRADKGDDEAMDVDITRSETLVVDENTKTSDINKEYSDIVDADKIKDTFNAGESQDSVEKLSGITNVTDIDVGSRDGSDTNENTSKTDEEQHNSPQSMMVMGDETSDLDKENDDIIGAGTITDVFNAGKSRDSIKNQSGTAKLVDIDVGRSDSLVANENTSKTDEERHNSLQSVTIVGCTTKDNKDSIGVAEANDISNANERQVSLRTSKDGREVIELNISRSDGSVPKENTIETDEDRQDDVQTLTDTGKGDYNANSVVDQVENVFEADEIHRVPGSNEENGKDNGESVSADGHRRNSTVTKENENTTETDEDQQDGLQSVIDTGNEQDTSVAHSENVFKSDKIHSVPGNNSENGNNNEKVTDEDGRRRNSPVSKENTTETDENQQDGLQSVIDTGGKEDTSVDQSEDVFKADKIHSVPGNNSENGNNNEKIKNEDGYRRNSPVSKENTTETDEVQEDCVQSVIDTGDEEEIANVESENVFDTDKTDRALEIDSECGRSNNKITDTDDNRINSPVTKENTTKTDEDRQDGLQSVIDIGEEEETANVDQSKDVFDTDKAKENTTKTDEDQQDGLQSVINTGDEEETANVDQSKNVADTGRTACVPEINSEHGRSTDKVIDAHGNRINSGVTKENTTETDEDQQDDLQSVINTGDEENSANVDRPEAMPVVDETLDGVKTSPDVLEINMKINKGADIDIDVSDESLDGLKTSSGVPEINEAADNKNCSSAADRVAITTDEGRPDLTFTKDSGTEDRDPSEKIADLDDAVFNEFCRVAIVQISRIDVLLAGQNTIKINDQQHNLQRIGGISEENRDLAETDETGSLNKAGESQDSPKTTQTSLELEQKQIDSEITDENQRDDSLNDIDVRRDKVHSETSHVEISSNIKPFPRLSDTFHDKNIQANFEDDAFIKQIVKSRRKRSRKREDTDKDFKKSPQKAPKKRKITSNFENDVLGQNIVKSSKVRLKNEGAGGSGRSRTSYNDKKVTKRHRGIGEYVLRVSLEKNAACERRIKREMFGTPQELVVRLERSDLSKLKTKRDRSKKKSNRWRSNQSARYYCKICPFTADTKFDFLVHKSVEHKAQSKSKAEIPVKYMLPGDEPDVVRFKCIECEYVVESQWQFNNHLLVHKSFDETEVFRCPDCPYVTKRKADISGHRKARHEENAVDLTCPHCKYRTRSKSYLSRHIREVHDRRKSLSCPQCPFETKRTQSLDKHRRSIHGNVDEWFPCDRCTYKFKSKGKLERHILTHSDP